MASITLKNVPHDLLERLREAAQQQRRSVTQQALHMLSEALGGEPLSRPAAFRQATAQVAVWRKLAGQWKSDEPVANEVGSIYASRTGGRKVDL